MRVYLNGQSFQSPLTRQRGIGRYARTLVSGLAAVRPDWKLTCVQFSHLPAMSRDDLPAGAQLVTFTPTSPFDGDDWRNRAAQQRELGNWLAAEKPDVYLNPSVCEGDTLQPLFGEHRVPHAAVVHDLIPCLYGPVTFGLWSAEIYYDNLSILRDADVLLANSQATAADCRRLYPVTSRKLTVIGGTTEARFEPAQAAQSAADQELLQSVYGVTRPFLFVGGADCWRKNMRRCVAGFALLPDAYRAQYELIIAGKYPESENQRIREQAAQLGMSDRVRQIGFVPDEHLAALYRACRVFLFPSLYEGLGLPIVEALRCGAMVVTSDTSSMPEYAGPMSFLCDPLDPRSIAAAMTRALQEPPEQRRAERIAFGYRHTPQTVGSATAEAIAARLAAAPLPTRPRLAVPVPLLPQGGVPAPVLEELERLRRNSTVELVFTRQPTEPLHHLRASYLCLTQQQFWYRQKSVRYDAVWRGFPYLPMPQAG